MAALAAGCLLFGVLGLLSEAIFHNRPVATGLYLLAYLCGGWDAAGDAWERIRKGQLDVHFLMLAVAVGAGIIGAWREGALLLFLFSASGAMEHFAMGRTKKAIDALFRGAPKTARVLKEGLEVFFNTLLRMKTCGVIIRSYTHPIFTKGCGEIAFSLSDPL